MTYECEVRQTDLGSSTVRHQGTDFGPVEVTAPAWDEASETVRRELHHRWSLCPCTGRTFQNVEIKPGER